MTRMADCNKWRIAHVAKAAPYITPNMVTWLLGCDYDVDCEKV